MRTGARFGLAFVLLISAISLLPQPVAAQHVSPIISQIAWKPDGSMFAVGYDDGTLEIRNIDGSLQQNLVAHSDYIITLEWHPMANQLLSDSRGQFLLWDLMTGMPYELGEQTIRKASWNSDFSKIIASDEGYLLTWNAQVTPPRFLDAHSGDTPIYDIAWSPDRSQAATRVLGDIILRDPLNFDWKERIPFGGNGALAWRPDGQQLAASNWLGEIRIWTLFAKGSQSSAQNEIPTTFSPGIVVQPPLFGVPDHPTSSILTLKFSDDGMKLLSFGGDGTFTDRDIATGQICETMQLPGAPIRAAAFSPDGRRLAYGDADGSLQIVNINPCLPAQS